MGFCFVLFQNMELNRAQQLVHDDAALARFRRDHEILHDMLIEQTCPNEVAAMVRGHGDRIPVRTWLIHQIGLRFLVSPMLKEVMARCGLIFMQVSMNFVRAVLVVDTLMQRKGLPFSSSDLPNVYIIIRPKRELVRTSSRETITSCLGTVNSSHGPGY